MICPNCGRMVPDSAERCAFCGRENGIAGKTGYQPGPLVHMEGTGGTADALRVLSEKIDKLAQRPEPDGKTGKSGKKRGGGSWIVFGALLLCLMLGALLLGIGLGRRMDALSQSVSAGLDAQRIARETGDAALQTAMDEKAKEATEQLDRMEAALRILSEQASAPLTYTLSFDPNEPETASPVAGMPAQQTTEIGSPVLLSGVSQPTCDGWRFLGWGTRRDGTGALFAGNGIVDCFAADTVLYAQWERDQSWQQMPGTQSSDAGTETGLPRQEMPGGTGAANENP